MTDPKTEVSVIAYKNGEFQRSSLHVIKEEALTLNLGQRQVVTLLYNGQNPLELAAGFFFSEGFLESKDDIADLTHDPENLCCTLTPKKPVQSFEEIYQKRLVTSGCGKGSSFYHVLDAIEAGQIRVSSGLQIGADRICALSDQVFHASKLYRDTHGVHSAALCAPSGQEVFFEDIGRHNAIDKISGHCLLNRVKTSDKLLFTTGRITSEVMIKAGRLGCPIVVSRSSSTAFALELAGKLGLTVIGGARKTAFHIYIGHSRIVDAPARQKDGRP